MSKFFFIISLFDVWKILDQNLDVEIKFVCVEIVFECSRHAENWWTESQRQENSVHVHELSEPTRNWSQRSEALNITDSFKYLG
jgi:hypothetical protein